MLGMIHARFTAAIFALGAIQATQPAPAVAQTTNECSAYSIQVCGMWDSLGYSSLKECRLQEYANCLNGIRIQGPASFKPEPAHPAFSPTHQANAATKLATAVS